MHHELRSLLSRGPVRRSDHPGLRSAFDHAVARGEVVPAFRGVYTLPQPDLTTRVRALLVADAQAIVSHTTAAFPHGWLRDPPDVVAAASSLRSRPGYALSRRRIPPRLVNRSSGLRRTSRALTVLDLALADGPGAIDGALRRRVPLRELWAALDATPQVAGNATLARWLRNSRSQPWSPAERAAHEALHEARIGGWVANLRVVVDADTAYDLDLAWRALRLAVEVDGFEHHDGRGPFEHDRRRDVALAEVGWQVVRFPASWVCGNPRSFARSVTRILEARRRLLS